MKKDDRANFSVSIDSIQSVSISYSLTVGGFGIKGYKLLFSFLLKDYTVVRFVPFNISGGGNNNKKYEEMLTFLQKNDVEIVDPYVLKDKLGLTSEEILNYINKIEENK